MIQLYKSENARNEISCKLNNFYVNFNFSNSLEERMKKHLFINGFALILYRKSWHQRGCNPFSRDKRSEVFLSA